MSYWPLFHCCRCSCLPSELHSKNHVVDLKLDGSLLRLHSADDAVSWPKTVATEAPVAPGHFQVSKVVRQVISCEGPGIEYEQDDLHFVAEINLFVHYVNEIYGNFSQPGHQQGRKLFSQVI